MKRLLFLTIGLIFVFLSQAQAAYIVDTGSGWEQFGVSIYNRTNGDYQFNAGQFTLEQAYTINSLETWMYSVDPGLIELVLYGDNGNLPDPANELLRQSFNVAAPGPITAWQGLTGLNLALQPGIYWISLEKTIPVDDFQVNLPSGAPYPLAHYAYRAEEDYDGAWTPYTGAQGFRVGANIIPEPATLSLLGIGLAGLLFKKKRSA